MTDYEIVTGDASEVEMTVRKMIADGYVPMGGVSVVVGDRLSDGIMYAQAMAKPQSIEARIKLLPPLVRGTTLILESEKYLAREQREAYSRLFERAFPEVKVVLLEGGIKCAALSQSSTQE